MVTIFETHRKQPWWQRGRKEGLWSSAGYLEGGLRTRLLEWEVRKAGQCLWRGCTAVHLCVLKVVVLSLKSKSIFQELNEPTSSMEGVQAGLWLFPASVERKEKSVSADCSWL